MAILVRRKKISKFSLLYHLGFFTIYALVMLEEEIITGQVSRNVFCKPAQATPGL